MRSRLQRLVFLIAALPALTVAGPPRDLPVAYTLEWPFLGGDTEYVLDVHQTEGLSVAATRKSDEPGLYQQAEQGGIDWPDLWAYYTGPRTEGRIASYETDHASIMDDPGYVFLVEQPLADFEPGRAYGQRSRPWRASDLEIDFRRGDDDATVAGLDAQHYVATLAFDYDFDTADEAEGQRLEFRRDFWHAPALPYSRLQVRHLDQHLFVDASNDRLKPAAERLNDAVLARLEPQMREAGMLVRTGLKHGDHNVVTEIRNLRSAPALDMQPVADTPLLRTRDQYMSLLEPLFGFRLLDSNPLPGGESSVKLAAAHSHEAAQAGGKAGFQIGEAGDLALALTFENAEGDPGYLFLVRPHFGRPAAGTYGVVGKRKALEEMSRSELRDYAGNFQVVGLISRGEDRLTAFTGETAGGQVEITESSDRRVTGRMTLDLESLAAYDDGATTTIRVSAEFDAVPATGLIQRASDTSELLADR